MATLRINSNLSCRQNITTLGDGLEIPMFLLYISVSPTEKVLCFPLFSHITVAQNILVLNTMLLIITSLFF
ncbi:hypothetical protein XENTR_v10014790 [Xenopus tropicalis]|nr:hypothetical protein XENTR_v10014790 [Xenopus tropicalis]